MRKKIHAFTCLCICILLTACGSENRTASAPELLEPVMSVNNTVKAEIGDIDNTEILKAEIIPYTEELSFDREGFVDTVFVKEGDTVKKGDKLAVLAGGIDNTMQRDINNEITSVKKSHAVENLELEYDIKILKLEKELLQDKVKKTAGKEKKETERELQIKQADINIAEQNLANRKEMQQIELAELERKRESIDVDIEDYYIYSTIDGVVSFIRKKSGDMASKGEFAIAVSDEERLHVRSDFINNKTYSAAKRCYITYNGNEYDVEMRPYDTEDIKDMLDSEIKVYSYFDFKDTGVKLGLGTYVDLRVESQSSHNVLILPVNAVYIENEKSYVYKNDNGRKVMTEIEKGIVSSTYVEVMSGLEEGDDVYVKP